MLILGAFSALLVFFAPGSFAAKKVLRPLVQCQSADEVAASLEFCSQNAEAVNKAIDCYEDHLRAWQSNAKALSKKMFGMQSRTSTRQQEEMLYSKSDYASSVDKMSQLIFTTEYNLARINEYSKVMLDFIGAEAPEESSSCYIENVAKLRRVEGDFVKMLEEAKAAKNKAMALGGNSEMREMSVGSNTVNKVIAPSRVPASAPLYTVKKGSSPHKRSDITGTERAKQKDILSAYKVRDQLIAP